MFGSIRGGNRREGGALGMKKGYNGLISAGHWGPGLAKKTLGEGRLVRIGAKICTRRLSKGIKTSSITPVNFLTRLRKRKEGIGQKHPGWENLHTTAQREGMGKILTKRPSKNRLKWEG